CCSRPGPHVGFPCVIVARRPRLLNLLFGSRQSVGKQRRRTRCLPGAPPPPGRREVLSRTSTLGIDRGGCVTEHRCVMQKPRRPMSLARAQNLTLALPVELGVHARINALSLMADPFLSEG